MNDEYPGAKVIPTNYYRHIQKIGTKTGSRLFCDKEGPMVDLDILIHKPDLVRGGFAADLQPYCYFEGEDYVDDIDGDCFFTLYCYSPRGMLLNLIVCTTPEVYEARLFATRMLIRLKNDSRTFAVLLHDKSFRTAQYRLFKDFSLDELHKYEDKECGIDLPF